jgi:hypothetical protein
MHINGQLLLTWIHMILQHSNASERELFKKNTLISRVTVSRIEDVCCIRYSSLRLFY